MRATEHPSACGWTAHSPRTYIAFLPTDLLRRGAAGASILLMLAVCWIGGAEAKVVSSDAAGFSVEHQVTVPAEPDDAFSTLLDVWRWWDPAHTWSGDPANLSIDARAGGCFCESLPEGGSAQHLLVIYAEPGSTLRMVGGLGPLQDQAVSGAMTWSVAPEGEGSVITMTYRVSGRVEGGMEAWAGLVDSMLGGQIARLADLLDD